MVTRTGCWRTRRASRAASRSVTGAWDASAGTSSTSRPNRGAVGCSATTIDQSAISSAGMSKPKKRTSGSIAPEKIGVAGSTPGLVA